MKKLIIGLLIAVSSSGSAMGQRISLISATSQGWSGGVAGHHGINYRITLKVDDESIKLDSCYVNENGFLLIVGHSIGVNTIHDSVKHTYSIRVGESYNDMDQMHRVKENVEKAVAVPHRNYNGSGLITYYYKGKKELFTVNEMQSLPSLNYP